MLIRNKHCEQFDSFIESVQILPCPQLGKFIKKSYMWDPTSGQATRPLAMFNSNSKTLSDARLRDVNFRDVRFDVMLDNSQNIHYYTHDANKNVTELISDSGAISAHYEYSPFGATITSSGDLSYSNPFQFSSEIFDSELGLTYYNYRHYNPLDGRWINRDPIEEQGGYNLYQFNKNNIINIIDILGRAWYNGGIADFIRCMDDCIKDNDPFPILLGKILLMYAGQSVPKTWVAGIAKELGLMELSRRVLSNTRYGDNSPYTSIPRVIQNQLKIMDRTLAIKWLGKLGARANIALITYGTVLAMVEMHCACVCTTCVCLGVKYDNSMSIVESIQSYFE